MEELTDKVEILNDFFHSTFTTSMLELPSMDNMPAPLIQLDQIEIDSSDVFEALRCLDPTKAVGCDGVSPYFLKSCATALADLSHTYSIPLYLQVHFLGSERYIKLLRYPRKVISRTPLIIDPFHSYAFCLKVMESIVYDKIISFIPP